MQACGHPREEIREAELDPSSNSGMAGDSGRGKKEKVIGRERESVQRIDEASSGVGQNFFPFPEDRTLHAMDISFFLDGLQEVSKRRPLPSPTTP